MGEFTKLGDAPAFKAFLGRLQEKRALRQQQMLDSGESSRSEYAPPGIPRPPTGECPVCNRLLYLRDDQRHCSLCHFDVGPGEHGFLRQEWDPAKRETQLVVCPECTYQDNYDETRRRRQFQALLAGASLPSAFATFDLDTYRAVAAGEPVKQAALADVAAWVNGTLQQAGYRNLYLWGPVGTGKTGLAIAALKARMHRGTPALYTTLPDLLDRIRQTYDGGTGSTATLLHDLGDIDVLVLDDLGAERPTDWVVEKLFQVLDHRMRAERETLFTSNLTLDQLTGRLGERVVERIRQGTWEVEVSGRNLRRPRVLVEGRA